MSDTHYEIDLRVDWLVNEHCDTLLIEGHVDLALAARAMRDYAGDSFPAPRHAWMRNTTVPEDKPAVHENANDSRGECDSEARGAVPVTISMRPI